MILSIVTVIMMGVLAVAAKGITRDWLHPAPMFSVVWGCNCCLSIFFAPEITTSASGVLWVLLNVTIVTIGALGGTAVARRNGRRSTLALAARPAPPLFSKRALRVVALACSVAAGLWVFLWLRMQGFALGDITGARDVGTIAGQMSTQRYSAMGQAVTWPLQMLLSALYLAPLLGGTLFVLRARLCDTVPALLTLLPSVLAFTLQSTRSAVLFAGVMWAAGYMTMRVYSGSRLRCLSFRTVSLGTVVVLGLSVVVSAGAVLRSGTLPTAADVGSSVLSAHTKNYLFGHTAALSIWLDSVNLSEIKPALGRYTVGGVWDLAMPGTRAAGVFPDLVVTETGPTNVYTIFRGLIEDATLPGALFVILVLSFASGIAYRRAQERQETWCGILAACYAGTMCLVTSIFNYNTILLAMIVYWAIWTLRLHRRR